MAIEQKQRSAGRDSGMKFDISYISDEELWDLYLLRLDTNCSTPNYEEREQIVRGMRCALSDPIQAEIHIGHWKGIDWQPGFRHRGFSAWGFEALEKLGVEGSAYGDFVARLWQSAIKSCAGGGRGPELLLIMRALNVSRAAMAEATTKIYDEFLEQ